LTTEDFARKKVQIRDQNITRSAKIIDKQQKHKYLHAWKNVTRWLKHKRVSTVNLLEAQSSYAVKRLIKKWRARTDMTIAARGAYSKFQEKRDLIYKRAIYNHFKLKHDRDKTLVLKLSNMAQSYDNKGLQSAFQMIKNFATAKKNVFAQSQSLSTRNLANALLKVYRRKLLSHYTHLRRQVFGNKVVEMKKKLMFAHFISASTRDAFMRWKSKALFAQTVVEVNEIGPVVEEVLDKQMEVQNLQKLMADEGFTNH